MRLGFQMPDIASHRGGIVFPLGHLRTGVTLNLICPPNPRLPKLRPNRKRAVRFLALYILPMLTIASCGGAGLQTNGDQFSPNTAPSITSQPGSQTVKVGQSGVFAVGASGTGPLSYQWQKNGTPISGATSATYATPATTAADDG